jgi:leucine efflux protein
MLGVTDLGVFIAGTIAIVLLPGPNSLYVLTVSARSGLRMGYAGALGVLSGDTVLMVLTALGAAQVLQSNPLIYQGVRWAGALYLSYLGLRLVWGAAHAVKEAKVQRMRAEASREASDGPGGTGSDAVAQVLAALKPVAERRPADVYRKALVISVLNPKAILFFLSFFVQFVDPTYAYPALSFLLLGAIVQTASFVYLSALIFGGVRLAQTFAQRKRLSALLSTTVGLLFIGFGVRLAS